MTQTRNTTSAMAMSDPAMSPTKALVAVTAIPNLIATLSLGGVFARLMRDEVSGEQAFTTAVIEQTGPTMRGFGATSRSTMP